MTLETWPVALLQEMVDRAMKMNQTRVIDKVRALPTEISVGDYFSGTGSFTMAIIEALDALAERLPDIAQDLHATWTTIPRVAFFCFQTLT